MAFHDFLLIFVGLISEIIGTISGFGSSTYFVPIALFFEKFSFVITITAILHTFSNLFKIWMFRHTFNPKLFVKMALPSILFCGLGALLVPTTNLDLIKLLLGIFLMSFTALSWFRSHHKNSLSDEKILMLSTISGFLTGFLGTGGALRGLALSALNIPKESFVFLSSGIDIGGDLLRLGMYLSKGYMEWSQWYYIPFLFVAATIGTNLGKRILKRIPQHIFEKTVLFFTFGSGLLLSINALTRIL